MSELGSELFVERYFFLFVRVSVVHDVIGMGVPDGRFFVC